MMRKLVKLITSIFLLVLLMACGGGGGSAGSNPNVPTTVVPVVTPTVVVTTPTNVVTTPTVVSSAADFIFELDKTSILNSGSDRAVLTVLVVDKNRNVVANVPVTVSLDSGGVFSVTSSSANTDANGRYVGNISVGGNKANRIINATITVNGIVKIASVVVSGSQVTVTPIPATPTPGQLVVLNFSSIDAVNSPIQNASISIVGTNGLSRTITTDLSGLASTSFSAPASSGTYTFVVTGLGVSTTKIIQVVATGTGGFANAIGPVSSASLSPQPTSIAPNLNGNSTNRAKLSAKFLTTGNVGIQNMRVRFEITPPLLGSGEAISTGDSVVYSDASGTAEADYIAGTRSSPTNGVTVRACYSLVDFTSRTDCPNQLVANLTVAGAPLSITIGDDNKLAVGLGNIAYLKQFLIQVNDSAGVAVKDAIVTASVDITHYGKGVYDGLYPLGASGTRPPSGTNSFATIQATVTTTAVVTTTTVAPSVLRRGLDTFFFNVWCANEDKNRNGFLDVGEDINGDNIIQPRKAEIIVSYLSGNRTDASGQLLLQVSYPQNVGTWLAYTLRATTSVEGSEGDASKTYITDVLDADVVNGSFLTPPYGVNSCRAVD